MIKEFQREYRWLSNFSPVKIELEGTVYSSVEHAYMSAKSDEKWWKEFCSNANNTPGQVKRKSKELVLKLDWEDSKVQIMAECINQKFNQEPYKSKLISTGNTNIQEGNHWGDTFWGISLATGKGLNTLGKLIMDKRAMLLTHQN